MSESKDNQGTKVGETVPPTVTKIWAPQVDPGQPYVVHFEYSGSTANYTPVQKTFGPQLMFELDPTQGDAAPQMELLVYSTQYEENVNAIAPLITEPRRSVQGTLGMMGQDPPKQTSVDYEDPNEGGGIRS